LKQILAKVDAPPLAVCERGLSFKSLLEAKRDRGSFCLTKQLNFNYYLLLFATVHGSLIGPRDALKYIQKVVASFEKE